MDLTLTEKSLNAKIAQFADFVKQGIDAWTKAGELLVLLKATDSDICKKITERNPDLTPEILEGFIRIGNRQVYPPLLASGSTGASLLMKCSYAVQEKYHKEPIDVAVSVENGVIKTVKKKVCDLSKKEAAIVFSRIGTVNNIEQQGFRLREAKEKVESAPSLMKNVDIGYFALKVDEEGVVTVAKCAKNPLAQPVRVIQAPDGFKTSVVVFYKTPQ